MLSTTKSRTAGKTLLQTLFFFLLVTQISFAQWVQTSFDPTEVNCLAVKDTNLFVGTWEGVFLSTNNGISWTAVNNGLTSTNVPCLAVSDTNLFAGTDDNGVFLSTNNGISWTAVNNGLTSTNVPCLAVSDTNLFAGTDDNGVFLSTNNGTSWTTVNNGLTFLSIDCIAVSDNNLFAGTWEGVFFSSNNGTNWTAVNNGLGLDYLYVLSLGYCGTNLFAGATDKIFRTTDYGATWIEVYFENQTKWSFAATGTKLFAGSSWGMALPGPTISGIFLTTDLGINWIPVNDGFPNQKTYVTSLAVKDSFLFAAANGAVWRRPLSEMITSIEQETNQPTEYMLSQNYPNPFNPSTKISWQSPVGSHQTIKVFDVLGNEIATLVDDYKSAGRYEVEFNATTLPSGVYFYQLRAGEYTAVKKMLLVK